MLFVVSKPSQWKGSIHNCRSSFSFHLSENWVHSHWLSLLVNTQFIIAFLLSVIILIFLGHTLFCLGLTPDVPRGSLLLYGRLDVVPDTKLLVSFIQKKYLHPFSVLLSLWLQLFVILIPKLLILIPISKQYRKFTVLKDWIAPPPPPKVYYLFEMYLDPFIICSIPF